ncbi:prohibitin family protein [Candidatus Woesearchaeota archaeon]|nr:prohibitin family protein [Candidatus Woesearchaeota archaeon]
MQMDKVNVNVGNKLRLIGFIVIVVIIFFGCFYTVSAGYRGVLLTFGKPSAMSMGEGLHFKAPLVQTVVKMEVRTQKVERVVDSSSKDLQDVQTTVALNFHVSPSAAQKLYTEVGLDYAERIIQPSIEEVVKSISATYTAEELITKRPDVKREIKDTITTKLAPYYLIVDDMNIVNFQFSEEFDHAIEQKVTAEQLKLKAERDLERIKIEKEQQIAQAQGEAEALRLQKMVVTPELIQLREIEMMISAIDKWDGVMPQATSGMPFIDVSPKNFGEE